MGPVAEEELMVMENFTPWSSLAGGLLIGLASALILAVHGRVCGISGILGRMLRPELGDVPWRIWFLAGLALAGFVGARTSPQAFVYGLDRSMPALLAAGVLVGVGTRLGNGCTSGHGVCGLSRLSPRSALATATFMAVAAATVAAVRILAGGVL
jgi:uncharacterized membrane protein YedE/YeeE